MRGFAMAISSRGILVALVLAGCASQTTALHGQADDIPLFITKGEATSLRVLRRGRRATVLVFWSASCPCVRRYQERVETLLERYQANGVLVVGVSSNADETLADVQRVSRERGLRLPIWRDEDGLVAQSLDVRTTPTVVVLDERGQKRFQGWIDNERAPGEADREPWLESALQGVLENRNDFAPQTPIYGCAITRRLFGTSQSHSCLAPNGPTKGSPE